MNLYWDLLCFLKQQFLFPHTLTTSFTPVCLTSSSSERHSFHPHTLYTKHTPAIHLPDCTHTFYLLHSTTHSIWHKKCLFVQLFIYFIQLNISTQAGLGCLINGFTVPRKVPHTKTLYTWITSYKRAHIIIFVMRIISIRNTVKSWKFLGGTAGRG